MILQLSVVDRYNRYGTGYIAGTADGILTVAGVPASRAIYLYELYDYKPMIFVAKIWSTASGHYIFSGLDLETRYLVIARDYAREYEPFAWDYVKPANDLTIAEQKALWQTWQT